MKLTTESKILLGVVLVTVAIIGVAVFAFSQPEKTYACSDLIPSDVFLAGNPEADVCLVEFSDFQCPACASFAPVVQQIIDQYGDNIRVAYRHFPLSQHPYSKEAAIAAEAAGVQGKFWEMTELLFENQDRLSDDMVNEFTLQLELDEELFAASLTDQTIIDKVERDRLDAQALGVNETPTFFLNGKKLTLFSQADLVTAVEEALSQ